MTGYMPGCTWKPEWSVFGDASQQGFECNMQQTEIVSVVIDSTNIKLIKMFALPLITVSYFWTNW